LSGGETGNYHQWRNTVIWAFKPILSRRALGPEFSDDSPPTIKGALMSQRLLPAPPALAAREHSLSQLVQRSLRQSGYPGLSAVDVLPTESGVRLRGDVASYYLKQVAQTIAGATTGVMSVQNDLRVRRDS